MVRSSSRSPHRSPHRRSKLTPRVIANGASSDNIVDDSVISTQIAKQQRQGSKPKSAMKRHRKTSSKPKLHRSRQKRSRKVSFDTNLTLAQFKKIPKACARDVWYTAGDVDRFRMKVLESKEFCVKNKLKSARCRNHMRRVLFQYRISREDAGGKTESRREANRAVLNLSQVSLRSSEKTREIAIRNALRLEREIIAEASCMNPTMTNAFLGPSSHWSFEYYLGTMLDTLCTVE
mmetsp:Transcript_6414/g.15573  ORF Transcript_6414/g.15573 Transcript_6414/m.15573 type:complete len:234 (+) Transcript_6414:263-964(+)